MIVTVSRSPFPAAPAFSVRLTASDPKPTLKNSIALLSGLKLFWLEHRSEVRGWAIVLAILFAFLSVLFAYDRMYNPETDFLGTEKGQVSKLVRASKPGDYAMGSSLWELEIVLSDGKRITAQSPFLVPSGSEVCLASFTKGCWGQGHWVIGEVKVMVEEGVDCSTWQPASENR